MTTLPYNYLRCKDTTCSRATTCLRYTCRDIGDRTAFVPRACTTGTSAYIPANPVSAAAPVAA